MLLHSARISRSSYGVLQGEIPQQCRRAEEVAASGGPLQV